MGKKLKARWLGLCDYEHTVTRMREYTEARNNDSPDELWLLEHPPIYTLGRTARSEHLLDPGKVPVVQTDRGGQITYHGPGQLIVYPLIDLRRRGIGIKRLVELLEQSVIDLLARHSITAARRKGAPGVYVGTDKIAALGLRVRRGCSYHGLSFNVSMDLRPFRGIDPCGYPGLGVTRFRDLKAEDVDDELPKLGRQLADILTRHLGYDKMKYLS